MYRVIKFSIALRRDHIIFLPGKNHDVYDFPNPNSPSPLSVFRGTYEVDPRRCPWGDFSIVQDGNPVGWGATPRATTPQVIACGTDNWHIDYVSDKWASKGWFGPGARGTFFRRVGLYSIRLRTIVWTSAVMGMQYFSRCNGPWGCKGEIAEINRVRIKGWEVVHTLVKTEQAITKMDPSFFMSMYRGVKSMTCSDYI